MGEALSWSLLAKVAPRTSLRDAWRRGSWYAINAGMEVPTRHLRLLSLMLICGVALSSCQRTSNVHVIRLGHGLPTSHPVHQSMVVMAQRVAEKSGGQMRIDIYPGQQLGTERECLELLQIGSLGMTKVSAAVMEAFAPSYKVLSLPYVYRDEEHRFKVWAGPVGKEILRDGEQYYLRGLCYYDAGCRSFYMIRKPIHRPEDLAGLKIRTQESPTAVAMVRALGASPTPIAWGELYTALQQGVVDGAENNPPSLRQSRHYEVAKYYSLNEHTAVPDVLLIGTKTWNDLSEQERRWLQEAADESAAEHRVLWRKATEEALRDLEAKGVTILRPERAAFVAKVEAMLKEFRHDPHSAALLERIEQTR